MQIKNADQLELLFLVSRILGDSHDGVFNGTLPGHDGFHGQFVKSGATIWDDMSWPVKVSRINRTRLGTAAADVFQEIRSLTNEKTACDLLFRYEHDEWQVIVIPRKRTPPYLRKRFGALEMSGFCLVDHDDMNARDEVRSMLSTPGRYVEALNAYAA